MTRPVVVWSHRWDLVGWDSWGVRLHGWRLTAALTLRHARSRRLGSGWRLRRGFIRDDPVTDGSDSWYAGAESSAVEASVMLHWRHRRPRAPTIRAWPGEGREI